MDTVIAETEPYHPLPSKINGVLHAQQGRDRCCPGSRNAPYHQRLKSPEHIALVELLVVGKQVDP